MSELSEDAEVIRVSNTSASVNGSWQWWLIQWSDNKNWNRQLHNSRQQPPISGVRAQALETPKRNFIYREGLCSARLGLTRHARHGPGRQTFPLQKHIQSLRWHTCRRPSGPSWPPRAGWFLETLDPYFAYRFAFGSSIYECVSYAATVYRGHARAHT